MTSVLYQVRDRTAHATLNEPSTRNSMTKAMVNLGATLASESKFAEAELTVEQALKLEPENTNALELLKMIRGARERREDERQ